MRKFPKRPGNSRTQTSVRIAQDNNSRYASILGAADRERIMRVAISEKRREEQVREGEEGGILEDRHG